MQFIIWERWGQARQGFQMTLRPTKSAISVGELLESKTAGEEGGNKTSHWKANDLESLQLKYTWGGRTVLKRTLGKSPGETQGVLQPRTNWPGEPWEAHSNG